MLHIFHVADGLDTVVDGMGEDVEGEEYEGFNGDDLFYSRPDAQPVAASEPATEDSD